MSYTRMRVLETAQSWAEGMKGFRKSLEPGLNAFKKQKVLSSWSLVQTGENAGMLITNFPNKAAMNKYHRTMDAIRRSVEEEAGTGDQSWVYHGPVKASG